MAELEVQNSTGKKVGKHKVSDAISGAAIKPVSLHRAVVAEEAHNRQGTQKTKTRSEVQGGGRKPYKQKKTGNARQGTIRAPHYAHGGMALALSPRPYDKKINKKERRAAIIGAFGAQIEAGNVTVLDKIAFAEPKTKDGIALLKALGLENQRRVLVIVPAYDPIVLKSLRNLPNVSVRTAPSTEEGAKTNVFSARDILLAQKIVIAKDALTKIEEVWAK